MRRGPRSSRLGEHLEHLHAMACLAVERGLPASRILSAILVYVEAAEKAGLPQTAEWWRRQARLYSHRNPLPRI